MEKFLQQIQAFLRGLTLGQRVVLVGGALLVAAVVWGFTCSCSATVNISRCFPEWLPRMRKAL